MAKKELTEFDILKKQYSNLQKINQRIKNISSGYYIAHGGVIYLLSSVDFIEKVIVLNDPSLVDRFFGCMIMPNAFFDFTKNAKKTKLTIDAKDNEFIFGQNDNDEISYHLTIVNKDASIDKDYLKVNLIPKMYKRFFEIKDASPDYVLYKNDNTFLCLTSEQQELILSAKPVYMNFNHTTLTLTKQLIGDIKKSDGHVSIARVGYKPIDEHLQRVFYVLKQDTDIYECYTLFNTLQSN